MYLLSLGITAGITYLKAFKAWLMGQPKAPSTLTSYQIVLEGWLRAAVSGVVHVDKGDRDGVPWLDGLSGMLGSIWEP